jgi:hypothetical protein
VAPAARKSDRVSSHTSLSLIHSLTLKLDNAYFNSDDLLNHASSEHSEKEGCCVQREPMPSPIDIPVLAILVADMKTSASSKEIDLDYLAKLVHPDIFIATFDTAGNLLPGTRAKAPRITLWVESPVWTHLRAAYVSGVWIHPMEFDGYKGSGNHPTVAYDLVHLEKDDVDLPEVEGEYHDSVCGGFAVGWCRIDAVLQGWVSSVVIKTLLDEQVAQRRTSVNYKVERSAKVAIERALRFRTEVAKGIHKGLDWGALEEM